MNTSDIKTSEWLEDIEIRTEYGSATFRYDIATVLVAARKMKNLTQVALAKIAGVSQAYIAKLESGEANPTIGRIGAILASIWLKSEITLEPLVPIINTEIHKRNDPNNGIVRHQQGFNMRQYFSSQERTFDLSIAVSAANIAENSNIPNIQEDPKTTSNVSLIVYFSVFQQNIISGNLDKNI